MTFLLEPDESGSKINEAEITIGELVETREDTTIVLELVEKALDQMTLSVEMCIITTWLSTSFARRNDRFRPQSNNLCYEGI